MVSQPRQGPIPPGSALWKAELTFIRYFQISKKLFWISEKEFVISEILAHEFQIPEITISDIQNNFFGYLK